MDKKILFLHIPKAAGQTFYKILGRTGYFYNLGSDPEKRIDEFISLASDSRNQYAGIEGHMGYGLHKYFNEESTYITFMRDPVDRVISFYNYIICNPMHYLHNDLVKENSIMPLNDFLDANITQEIDNLQVRLLSSTDGKINSRKTVTENDYNAAINNVDRHFSVVGIVEQFNLSLLLMKYTLGLSNIYYKQTNVGVYKKQKIDGDTFEKIECLNRLDCKFYKRQYNVLIETALNCENIESHFNRFVRGNIRYGGIMSALNFFKKIIK